MLMAEATVSAITTGASEARHAPVTPYRAEIDGLRAIAVWSVILYHAKVPLLSAGFLGVDIFFVISGYLISKTLIGELETGRFSILKFYERRVRRIIPALVVMSLISAAAAYAFLIPGNMKSFGQSLVATTLSANNILLFFTANYFDLSSELKPLIHTWSLGVEEQYYFVVPLLMLATFRLGRRSGVQIALLLIAGVSFAYCLWASRQAPSANFYLLFSRAWELAAGATVALGEPRLRSVFKPGMMLGTILACAALLLTVVPLLALDARASMPDAWTLLPVAGVCALLLFTGGNDPATRLLRTRPMVWFGLLSYSAYLYHQPLFAFARLTSLTEPGVAIMTSLVVVSFICAWLSWRFVERPFRDRRRVSAPALLMFCGAASLLALGVGMAMHLTAGFPETWPANIRRDDGLNPAQNKVYVEAPRRFANLPFEPGNPGLNVLVLGDSFGRDFVNMGWETGHLTAGNISYSDGTGPGGVQEPGFLQHAAEADFIVLAAAYENDTAARMMTLKAALSPHTAARFAIIGTKNFGLDNNAVMLLPAQQRYSARVHPLAKTVTANAVAERTIPSDIFVDVLKLLADAQGRVPVFTPDRRFISQDTHHLTKAGARYVGEIIFRSPVLAELRRRPQ